MNEKIKQEVVDTILQEGVDFTVTISNPNWLHRIKILPIEKVFKIYPIKLGTLLKIAKILIEINPDQLESLSDGEDGSFLEKGFSIIVNNKDNMIKVIAYGIVNRKREPSKRLINFLDYNLTPKELLKILILVIRQMDVTDFLASMVFVVGKMNLLRKTETKKEISGESSEG